MKKRIGIASAVTISFAPNYSGYGDASTKSDIWIDRPKY